MSFIVGICGGSGSGKSTFTSKLMEQLGGCAVAISHDDYYKHTPGMTAQERTAYNFDVPEALDTDLLAEHLHQLKEGKPAEIPIYNFSTQSRQEQTRHLDPVPVVVVEGILTMESEELRRELDLSIYIDVPADVRALRRILRDTNERGWALEGAVDTYMNNVRPAHERYVEPFKDYADVIITDALNESAITTLATGIKAKALNHEEA